MSSEKIRDWENRLPPELKQRIDELVNQLREHMDLIVRREVIIDKLIEDFISLCDEIGLPREETSVYIKYRLRGIISEDTIERHLPKDRKRKYERYQDQQTHRAELPAEEIKVSSDGSQSTADSPEGPTADDIRTTDMVYPNRFGDRYRFEQQDKDAEDEIAERAAEIALTNNQQLLDDLKDHQIRLNETFKLLEDKDKELDRMRLAMGEMELQIRDLKKNPPKTENIDEKEELQIKYDELLQAYEELKAVETLRVKQQDFHTASTIQSPPKVWVAAINALNLYRGLNEASKYAIEHNDPWKKVLFDITDNGQLKNARLEQAA